MCWLQTRAAACTRALHATPLCSRWQVLVEQACSAARSPDGRGWPGAPPIGTTPGGGVPDPDGPPPGEPYPMPLADPGPGAAPGPAGEARPPDTPRTLTPPPPELTCAQHGNCQHPSSVQCVFVFNVDAGIAHRFVLLACCVCVVRAPGASTWGPLALGMPNHNLCVRHKIKC